MRGTRGAGGGLALLLAAMLMGPLGGVAGPAAAADPAAPLSWPQARFAPCGAFDPDERAWYVVGGRGEDGVAHFADAWTLELPDADEQTRDLPSWRELTGVGAAAAPPPLRSCSAAWDPDERRLLVFGGWDGTTATNGVWALSTAGTPGWTQLCDATTCGPGPSPRRAASASYDPQRERLIVFGGVDTAFRNDAWSLSLRGSPRWSALTPAGQTPSPRGGHAQVHDGVRDRLWVVGGTSPGADLGDVWSLDLPTGAWTRRVVAEAGPAARSGAFLVHDTRADRLVYWGGVAAGAHPGDVHVLRGLTGEEPRWETLAAASEVAEPRAFGLAAYDLAETRMLVFGGAIGGDPRKDTIALHLPDDGTALWRGVAPATPVTARDQVAVHYERRSDALYAFGGFGSGALPGDLDTGAHLADTWRLATRRGGVTGKVRWRNVTESDTERLPLDREATAYASDPKRHRLLVFGGLHGNRDLADTWEAVAGRDGRMRWRQLCSPTSCGQAPPARWGGHAVYDPLADRLVVFGGRQSDGTTFVDTWTLSLGGGSPVWTRLDPLGPPPPRWGGAAGYDPVRHRLVVFGGQAGTDAAAAAHADTWALTLGDRPEWRQLQPAGAAPSARRSPAYAVRNAGGRRDDPVDLIVAAGFSAQSGTHHNDVWRLRLDSPDGAWERLVGDDCASVMSPTCRRSASAVYQPADDRLILVFGRDASGFFPDTFSFSFADLTWRRLSG